MPIGLAQPIRRVALFGAAPDTPNMGVSALYSSLVHSLSQAIDPLEIVVFDNRLGPPRYENLRSAYGSVRLIRHGARVGRRYYRPENLTIMSLAARSGPLGAYLNRAVGLIDSCDVVLDISGGDSFSDIYGRERFNLTYLPKVIALARRKPLLLLPQTYGPFKDPAVRRRASSAVQGAGMAWARDTDSFKILQALLGDHFDPQRHRCGVDMAFALPPRALPRDLEPKLQDWITNKCPATPLVGFNVSGLIYNDPKRAAQRYALKADYRRVVTGFLSDMLSRTAARIVLIPHVMDRPGHYESDLGACRDVAANLSQAHASRVCVSPPSLDEAEVKELISRVDWFCGTRMHATIAALSSGVPAAAISYSDKTLGVFETCGQGRHVLDPRILDSSAVIRGLFSAFNGRHVAAGQLRDHKPIMAAQVASQTNLIAEFVRQAAADRIDLSREYART